jgi:cyclophilin family peptidyl-prolyl cis-trans isomerase
MLTAPVAALTLLMLFPLREWAAPSQPITVDLAQATEVTLQSFTGQPISTVAATGVVDLRQLFPQLATAGTYILTSSDPAAAPQVIQALPNPLRNAPPGPMVYRIRPLQLAVLSTDLGDLTIALYYDTAPQSVDLFLRLIQQGFYDGLVFHRVVPNFLVQTGDPLGDGTASAGQSVPPEFTDDRPHLEGVLGIARATDPSEAPGIAPRPEYAATGGSQFYISLGSDAARQLDGRYTTFARVISGMEVLRAIAASPLADAKTHRPAAPVIIRSARLIPAPTSPNPYATLDTGSVTDTGSTKPQPK